MNIAPFEVGDVVEVKEMYRDILTDVPRVVTKIRWVGLAYSQSGWLVDAVSHDPAVAGAHDLIGYDSDWFIKA